MAGALLVLAALVLAPPSFPGPAPPRRRWRAGLEAAGLVDAGFGAGVAGGAGVRLEAGSRHLRGIVGLAALSPVAVAVGPARADLIRVPLDLGIRFAWPA